MTQHNLRKTIAGISQNKRIRAVALEVINGKATVKISGSRRPLYGLPITGGAIVAGQEVFVDYTSGQPIVSAYREDAPNSDIVSRVRTRTVINDPDVPLSGSDHTHIQSQITDLVHSATQLRGRTITTGSPVNSDILMWNEAFNEWQYSSGSSLGSGDGDSSGSGVIMATLQDGVMFTIDDILTTGSSPLRIYNKSGVTRAISSVFISIETPPTTGSVTINILKNGSSIFEDGGKPYISSGSRTGLSDSILTQAWLDGEFLTMSVDSTGSEASGANLVVQVLYSVSNVPVTYSGISVDNPVIVVVDQAFFSLEGEITSGSNPLQIYNTSGSIQHISRVFAYVDSPSSGSAIVIDVVKNGSSIFSSGSNMATILPGQNTGETTTIDFSEWAPGECLTINVLEEGTGSENAVIQVIFSKSAGVAGTGGGDGVSDHLLLSNIGTNSHAQIDIALERLADTSGENTGDQVVPGAYAVLENHYLTGYNAETGAFNSGSVVSSGGVTDHTELSNIGTNTHDQIDTALTRLAETSGSNTGDQVVPNTHEMVENHYLNGYDAATGLFTSGSVVGGASGSSITDHTELTNIGVNTHDQIDDALERLINTSGSNTGDQDLSDYLTDAPSDGTLYGRQDGTWAEITASGSSGASALSDLTDVTISGELLNGQALVYASGSGLWTQQDTIMSFIKPPTRPVLTDFTWRNQEIATAVESAGGIYLLAPQNSGDDFRVLEKDLINGSSGSYTVTALIVPQFHTINYNAVGLALIESVSGKMVTFALASAIDNLASNDTTVNTFASANLTVTISTPRNGIWLRIKDDGTNRILSWSVNGYDFMTELTEGRTTYCTPDKVGFFANSNNTTRAAAILLLSFEMESL